MSVSVILVILIIISAEATVGLSAEFVTEPKKKVPVIYDVDVVVAGAGVTGIFAALAAAKNGAETVLIERFESVGGISGPGRNPGGGTQAAGPWKGKGKVSLQYIYPEIAGIPKQFTQRLAKMQISQSRQGCDSEKEIQLTTGNQKLIDTGDILANNNAYYYHDQYVKTDNTTVNKCKITH